MYQCKICKVPLGGFLGKITKVIFKIRPSRNDPQVCNKCSDKESVKKEEQVMKTWQKDDAEPGSYQCQICGRSIHTEHALEHIKAEEYIMRLILKDHPQWHHKEPTCQECIEYYRKLVEQSEI